MLHDAHEIMGNLICSAAMEKISTERLAAITYLMQATHEAVQELVRNDK